MDFKQKYLKYKNKYLQLKKLIQIGGNNCSTCNKPGAPNTCQCGIKFYCGKECQTQDWKSHKVTHNEIFAAKIAEQAALVPAPRPTPFLGKQATKNMFEVALRKRSVDAVTDLYARLNRKFRYKSSVSDSWEHIYPLWHREPISPARVDQYASLVVGEPVARVVVRGHHDRYNRLKSICLPLFNTDLTECLAFESVPDRQAERAPIMECTSAFYMAKVAVLHRFNPSLAKKLFNISFLDMSCATLDPSEKLTGYDTRLEVKYLKASTLEGATKCLTLAEVTSLSLKDILLDERKAQRLEMASSYLDRFFVTSDKVKPGDGCYVKGHPSYIAEYGPYSGEHVYCVAPDQFIGLQGLDYGDFRDYTGIGTPKTLNQIRRSLAIEFLRVVMEEANGTKPRPDQIPQELIEHCLAEIPTEPQIYGALNIDLFFEHAVDIDLTGVVEVAAETAAQQSTLTDAGLIALLTLEQEGPIRALNDKKEEGRKKGGGNDNLYFDKTKFLLENYQIL